VSPKRLMAYLKWLMASSFNLHRLQISDSPRNPDSENLIAQFAPSLAAISILKIKEEVLLC
jgi:hypothetical protein